MFKKGLWGKLRSALSRSSYTEAWGLLAFWHDDTRVQAVEYLVAWLRKHPNVSREQPVRYTAWFDTMLFDAMLLETLGHTQEAEHHYQNLLIMKPDCIPAAIALHRLRGRSKRLLDYCCDHPWEKIEVGYPYRTTRSGYGEGAPHLWSMLLTGQGFAGAQRHLEKVLRGEWDLWTLFSKWEKHTSKIPAQFAFECLPFLGEILYRSSNASTVLRCAERLASWAGLRFWAQAKRITVTRPCRHVVDVFECLPRRDKISVSIHQDGTDGFAYDCHRISIQLVAPHQEPKRPAVQLVIPSPFLGETCDVEEGALWEKCHPSIACIPQAVVACLPLCICVGMKTADPDLQEQLWEVVSLCGPLGLKLYESAGATFGTEFQIPIE